MNRSKDWIKQAEKDIQAAIDSAGSKHFEWSCFQAQQGVEKAFKALLLSKNIESRGHGIVHMFKRWVEIETGDAASVDDVDDERMANERMARECIDHARKLMAFVHEANETISTPR